jgi:hypothetical protein
MLRSKSHHPWQPRVSDGQLLNPSAHTTESDTSFRDEIEEVEREVNTPAEPLGPAIAAGTGNAVEDDLGSLSMPVETPRGKSRWYVSLLGRFAGHSRAFR